MLTRGSLLSQLSLILVGECPVICGQITFYVLVSSWFLQPRRCLVQRRESFGAFFSLSSLLLNKIHLLETSTRHGSRSWR